MRIVPSRADPPSTELKTLRYDQTGMRHALLAAPLLVMFATTSARADERRAQAEAAYGQGVKLHEHADYLRAARAFARADELLPSSVALRAALDESLQASDPVLAMGLVDRAARAPNDGPLSERAAAVRARFAGAVGRISISCPTGMRCLATIDGESTRLAAPQWVRVGQHTVTTQLGDDEAQQRLVAVAAGETLDVPVKPRTQPASAPSLLASPSPSPSIGAVAAAEEDRHRARGLSPVFVYVGAGLTVAAGVATLVSGLDTRKIHDDFVAAGCAAAAASGCNALGTRGTNARTRTNVLAAGTAVVGAATVAVGLFAVKWSDRAAVQSAVVLEPGGARAALGGQF